MKVVCKDGQVVVLSLCSPTAVYMFAWIHTGVVWVLKFPPTVVHVR